MYCKDVMDLYPQEHLIEAKTSISKLISVIYEKTIDTLIVIDPLKQNNIIGVVTKDEIIKAYTKDILLQESVKKIINNSFEFKYEKDNLNENFFSEADCIIVLDNSKRLKGIITEKILCNNLLKMSYKKIKNTDIKKMLLQNNNLALENKNLENNIFIDLYNSINSVMHINFELWNIIENSSDSIYVTDGNGITVYANESFQRMTGVSVNDVLGRSVFDLEAKGFFRPSISAIVLKEKRTVTLVQKGYNGKDVIATGVPVFDDNDKINMVISNSKDIDDLSILKNYLLNMKSNSIKTFDDKNNKSKIIYSSSIMIDLMRTVNKVTQVDSTVLITGESGTGKGLIAKYIHENSERSKNKFIEINCSAIPETLFESELFGYESGAFTGAKKEGKPGILEKAHKGTLFLDEIGDMPVHMQVKLLKVLESKQLTRVGSVTPIDIDIRIIAATNSDLQKKVEDNNFRVDLYYRLNVFPIRIPPLRERKKDIQELIHFYLLCYNKKFNSNVELTLKAQNKLLNYSWPGNVRELDHFIERLVLMSDGLLDVNDFDIERNIEEKEKAIIVNKLLPLKKAIEETEKQLINIATKISENSYDVAELLEVSQSSAYRKMLKYNMKNNC